jgi:hypothetical protein
MDPAELDAYLAEIDAALDACFMEELQGALDRAAHAREAREALDALAPALAG